MARKPEAASAPPKGLREDTKSARTRERILDAAAKVLSQKGYAGTRLTDVAEVAELQAPAIYYYFPSREDLIEEVMWVGIADMRQHVLGKLEGLPASLTPMDRIMVAVEEHLRHELAISDYTTASIRNSGQVPESIRSRQQAEEGKYGEIWKKLLRDAADAGEIRPELDLRVARMLIVGALNWAAEWWNPRRGSLDTVVRNAQSIIKSGLGVATESPAKAIPQTRRRTSSAAQAADEMTA